MQLDEHFMRGMKASKSGLPIILFFSSFLSSLTFSNMAIDIMTPNQTIGVGQTIVSAGRTYELGFFSPGIAKKWYLGIWYKKISAGTIVWVANRDVPLVDPLGVLQIANTGILVLVTSNDSIIWSSNSSKPVHNPIAQLLDAGNFIVREAHDSDPKKYLWQSFDYISNTFLPGMKFGKNLRNGMEWHLTSWKSLDDPSPGNFTSGVNLSGFPQVYVMSGTSKKTRSGSWNGIQFTGCPWLKFNPFYSFGFIANQKEIYFYTELKNSSIYTRLVLDSDGLVRRYTWVDRTKGWVLYLSTNNDNCDAYALCGAYSNCKIDDTPNECSCLKGFVPKFPKDWGRADWLNGCVRRATLDCPRDGFVKHTGLKLPDTKYSWYNRSMNLEECRMMCFKNCSCTAYTNTDIRSGGSGCLLWFGELIDIRQFNENGQDLYVRMAASEIDEAGHIKKQEWIIVASVTMVALLLFGLACALYIRWRKQRKEEHSRDEKDESKKEDIESPIYAFSTIINSTNNFSDDNKIGEGGFGSVYKGILKGGQEIAVKRLSKFSKQGLAEFKNEVDYIAKLQHRNLVKLLGWCNQAEERMLIYEYMPNKSLDYFLFDEKRRFLLDWPKRFNIINGIARGLLYLHQDSRFRIIHRDLKVDNILLDNEMNPKISDFGMARSFGGNETEATTNKVVGTYGYIAPEYADRGLYSIKSDVYSFGVLVLEIVSGKRNRGFHHPDNSLNLLGNAWEYHMEGRFSELIDSAVEKSCIASEVLRSVQVGLLCVQQHSEDRPNMLTVIMMLGGEGTIPRPKQPAFFTGRSQQESNSSSNKFTPGSANEVTITDLEAR